MRKSTSASPGMSGTTARPPTLRKIRSACRTLVADPQRVRILEAGMTANDGAAVHAVKPVFDALAVAEHDLVFARLDFRHVHADRAGADAEVGAAPGQVRGVRAGHQCLGGDAAGVDAGPADQLALHHRNGVAGRGQPACQRGPGLAGAHDDRVETLLSQSSCRRRQARIRRPPRPRLRAGRSAGRGRAMPTRRLRAW